MVYFLCVLTKLSQSEFAVPVAGVEAAPEAIAIRNSICNRICLPTFLYLRKVAMQQPCIRGLYYITHIDNVPSILNNGILSRGRIEIEGRQPAQIHNQEIVNRRKPIVTPNGKSLWCYVNLFFQPRNPMMYCIINCLGKQNLAVFSVAKTVLGEEGIFITDVNAASASRRFYPLSEGLKILRAQQAIIQPGQWVSWSDNQEVKRKLMAECLVPNQVNPRHLQRFIVADYVVADTLRSRLSSTNTQRLVVAEEDGNDIFTPFSQVNRVVGKYDQ